MPHAEYELFAAIVESASLSAAARRLHLSPSIVSKRLSALETRLGARLLQRTTRRLSLTPIGEAFYQRVAAILERTREAEALVTAQAAMPQGRLRVSAPTSFGRLHLAPRLNGFIERYPQIRVEIDLSDSYVDLIADKVDVAIRIGPPPLSTLWVRRLAANRRLLCAAPDYLQRSGAPHTTVELRKHRLLAATGQLPWRLDGPEGRVVIEGESFVPTNSSEVVRELTLSGVGVALRSTWDVGDELRSGRLVALLPGYEGAAETGIYAVCATAEPVPANIRVFIDFLEQIYAPIPPWELSAAVRERGGSRRKSAEAAV